MVGCRMVGRAGDAMDGDGGAAVTSAAACVCVIGVERGGSDGGDRADIVFFCVSFSSTTVAHACIQDPRNKPTQVHMHIVRQYQTIQVYQVIFVPGGTMHSRVLPHTFVWHKCM